MHPGETTGAGSADVKALVAEATAVLRTAGIDSARIDAELLAAHVLNVDRARLGVLVALGAAVGSSDQHRFNTLIRQRADRTPVQLLMGTVDFFGVSLQVDSEVFIPRPETELLAEAARHHLLTTAAPAASSSSRSESIVVVDLCTGTGPLAAVLAATQLTALDVHAVEIDEPALRLATVNLEPHGVRLHQADATDLTSSQALQSLCGTAELVVSNPPYVPLSHPVEQAEAAQDPHRALYGGNDDGTEIPLQVASTAAQLLRAGGVLMMEHDASHAAILTERLSATEDWENVQVHQDLADRDRFLTAQRSATCHIPVRADRSGRMSA